MKMIQRSTRKSGHSVITTLPPEVLGKLHMNVGIPLNILSKPLVSKFVKRLLKKTIS